MGIQLRKSLFCLFQYLPERNIWFIHCLLGGKLSPEVTDEGAILYPTFPCRRRDLSPQRLPSPAPLGQSVAPSSDPASPAHLWFMVASPGPDRTVPRTVRPPRGRLWGWESPFLYEKPPPPARPAGGRAVTGVRYRAAGQAEKKRGPPQGPPNQKRWVQGGRTSSSLVFFPPAFFQRKPGPRPGPGGQRGAAPRGLVTAPTTQRVRSTLPPPARSRARTHVAGSNLRWSRRDHLSPPDGGVPGYITWKR